LALLWLYLERGGQFWDNLLMPFLIFERWHQNFGRYFNAKFVFNVFEQFQFFKETERVLASSGQNWCIVPMILLD
jgi:hypothetical protein